MALLQFMLTPRGPANRHSRALPLSPFWTSPQNLVTSRAHSLATAERAATRFWIASKARPYSFLHWRDNTSWLRVRQSLSRVGSGLTPRQFESMSLAKLAASSPAASSNLIVCADAGKQAVARTIDNINRLGFMASSHMKSAPVVKLSRQESCAAALREPNKRARPPTICARGRRRSAGG